MRIRGTLSLVLMIALVSFANAQTSRGISTAPDIVLAPAEGVYDFPVKKAFLYSFCVGQTDGFSLLVFPDEDGKRVEDRVGELFPYAYNVRISHLPKDPYERSTEAVLRLLDEAESISGDGDVVMLYFSGHGLVLCSPDTQGEYYFITSDTRKDDIRATALSGTVIRQYMERMAQNGVLVLAFVDTCHAEAMFPSWVSLTGNGGLACFASSKVDSQTIESSLYRSTEFTESLVRALEGEEIIGDLTVDKIAVILGAPTAGNVKPRVFNASDRVLLQSIDKKKQYHIWIDRYNDYIERGKLAIAQKEYSKAYFEFAEAHHMERGIKSTDRRDYSQDIQLLNRSVADAIAENEEDVSNPIWKELSQIRDSTYYLDRKMVSMERLYLGCGSHFYGEKDYHRAFSFFKKAHERGNKGSASYHMAKISEINHVGIKLGKSEVEKLYQEARSNGYDVEGFSKSRKELLYLAEAGNAQSQYVLARCFYYGDTLGFKKDYSQALIWLRKAAKQKHKDAIRYLGHAYRWGNGVVEDKLRAYGLYKKSAKYGSQLGEYYAALLEFNGEGVRKNQRKAVRTFLRLSNEGIPDAQYSLGVSYSEGIGTKKNIQLAIKYWLMAALSGDDSSQESLGYYYAFEQNPPDYDQGLMWLKKAAENKNGVALNNLGVLYSKGLGVEENDSLAFHYYNRSANAGSSTAYSNLSACYFYGSGVTPDLEMAEYWGEKASEADERYKQNLGNLYYDIGRYYLGRRYSFLKETELDYDKGFKYLKKAEEMGTKGSAKGELLGALGYCYSNGLGTQKDPKMAYEYWSSAAKEDNADAKNMMGCIYYKGEGVEKDYDLALSWFMKADEAGLSYATGNVGTCYLEAFRDTLSALKFFQKGASNGDALASVYLADYYFYGYPGVEKSYQTALKYYETAYRGGRKDSRNMLGWLYDYYFIDEWNAGNYSKAYEWCQKGVGIEYPISWYRLGMFYLNGKVVKQDTYQAYTNYVRSYENGCRDSSLIEIIPGVYSWLFAGDFNRGDYESAYSYCKKAVNCGAIDKLCWLGYMYRTGKGVEMNVNKAIELYDLAYEQKSLLSDDTRRTLGREYFNLFADEYNSKLDYKRALLWCERAIELDNESAKKWLSSAKDMAKRQN